MDNESASNPFLLLVRTLSFISPACCATATNVPAVSKKDTNKKVRITINILPVNKSLGLANASKAAPNVGAILGTDPTMPEGTGNQIENHTSDCQ